MQRNKIVGFMVCGPKEKYLKRTLEQFKRLCDTAVITLNNADSATRDLVSKYDFIIREDNREWGKAQPLIKTDALESMRELNPDWILALDADELVDPLVRRDDLEKLANTGGIGWYFYVVNLWNSEDRYLPGWSFWNIRFYKFTPEYGLKFQNKNVHCGLAPPMQYKWGNYAPFALLHYGLMDKKDRERKVARYNKYDPNAQFKDESYYEMLKANTSGSVLNMSELRGKISAEVEKYKVKGVQQEQLGTEAVILTFYNKDKDRTIDIQTVEVNKDREINRYNRMGWELITDTKLKDIHKVEAPVVEKNENECDICGFEAKNANGLRLHGKKHQD